ncbi:unnamed protein product [Rotaria sordida]|uniref:Nuclear condensin complex subunit 3 C-terminal domain-containing protein n=3 Tax=Rotaria sordida TaxID=392033 RepID=A0A814P565_9BILA|nr:unnamed protein product [Rotaria sordida]
MPSSPVGAPMGYSIWGYLEQLNRTHINSLGIGIERLESLAKDIIFTNTLNFVSNDTDNICSINDSILDRFCSDILSQIHYNVQYFIFESMIMERILLVTNYPNLNKLKIFKFNQDIALRYFTDETPFRNIFKQQIIDLTLIIDEKNDLTETIDYTTNHFSIFQPSTKMSTSLSLQDLPSTTFSSSTLIKLCINVLNIDDCLSLLNGRLEQLSILIVTIDNECTKNKKPVIRTLTGTKIILSQRVNGLTNDNNDDKRSRSPSPSSLTNSKRISSTFKPSMISSPNILSDRTNQIIINNDNQLLSKDTINERYQLITYTLNDIIQRCQNEQFEELTFIQCMTIAKVFIEQEKELELNNTDLKKLLDSLIKSGLSHKDINIQSQTLSTLRSLMCHSRQAAIEYIKQNLHITNKIENISLKCQSISTFIDVLLVHGLDILTNINLLNLTSSQFTTQYFLNFFDQQNIEIKNTIVFGLIKLFLSSHLEPNIALLKIILDYRFSNDYRSINQYQRDDITSFFYFFIHLSISNVLLIEELTFDLISRYLPFVSDHSTIAYKSILIESMCYFCIELLSLPTLLIDKLNEEHSHYHLAINLLESIHNSTNNHTSFIIKSYLNTIKHFQFQYMKKEQLQIILDSIIQLRQYPNLPLIISNSIKNIEEQIQSCLKLIKKLTNDNNDDKRSRSPSPSSQRNSKRISSTFKPSMISSPNILSDRTNQIIVNNDNRLLSKGVKRKLNINRYMTLDFENDTDDFF